MYKKKLNLIVLTLNKIHNWKQEHKMNEIKYFFTQDKLLLETKAKQRNSHNFMSCFYFSSGTMGGLVN